jgi:hypothetical protein
MERGEAAAFRAWPLLRADCTIYDFFSTGHRFTALHRAGCAMLFLARHAAAQRGADEFQNKKRWKFRDDAQPLYLTSKRSPLKNPPCFAGVLSSSGIPLRKKQKKEQQQQA